MTTEEIEARAQRAQDLFKQGYNCSQAVFASCADLYDMKDEALALRLSASFGGGTGRMRMTCGAANGMFMLAGLECGSATPHDNEGKMGNYKRVQQLAGDFKAKYGSLICAELLGLAPKGQLFIVWTLGSLSSVSWSDMHLLLPIIVLGLVFVLLALKPLNGLLLGEDYARGLGINVSRTRLYIVLATGLLAGGVTAFCGPIAFIGVAVPHIARGLFRTSNHRITVPASALLGACLLLVCDVLCSLFTYPLPISTVSALFGAPVIIWIILKQK